MAGALLELTPGTDKTQRVSSRFAPTYLPLNIASSPLAGEGSVAWRLAA